MPCYSGVIEVSDSVIDLFTRGVDLSYPPPPMPPGALLPKLPEVPKPPALPTAGK
jgi:hypothetical protein